MEFYECLHVYNQIFIYMKPTLNRFTVIIVHYHNTYGSERIQEEQSGPNLRTGSESHELLHSIRIYKIFRYCALWHR